MIQIWIKIDEDAVSRKVVDDLLTIPSELRHIRHKLGSVVQDEEAINRNLTALTEKVEKGTTLEESIKTLIEGMADLDPALGELADKLKGSTDVLLAAVRANVT